MANILIIFSSSDGQTQKICQRVEQALQRQAHQVTLVSIHESLPEDFTAFDKIVIGASIRYGRHHPALVKFIANTNLQWQHKPNAFFSVNIVARKPEKNTPETNPYLQKFLKQIDWKPKMLAVFAGKLDYPSYSVIDRTLIRLIMWFTKGPTDPTAVIEFTDWNQVDAFALRISLM